MVTRLLQSDHLAYLHIIKVLKWCGGREYIQETYDLQYDKDTDNDAYIIPILEGR